jgi:hypothetical protein
MSGSTSSVHRLMDRKWILSAAFCLLFSNAYADTSTCNCNVKRGDCNAQVRPSGQGVLVTADTQLCAQVVYYVDGDPRTVTIRYGKQTVGLASIKQNPQIEAGSCTICAATDERTAPRQGTQRPQRTQQPQPRGVGGLSGGNEACIARCNAATGNVSACQALAAQGRRQEAGACAKRVIDADEACLRGCGTSRSQMPR